MQQVLFIVGAGGHGRVCAEVAEAMGQVVEGFVDVPRTAGERVNGKPILFTGLADLEHARRPAQTRVFIAVGDNDRRCELLDEALSRRFELPALVHPSAVLSPTCMIGAGSVVMAGAVVNANTRVGRACILNTGCTIDHDNVLEDGVQICPGVHSAGNVRFGARAFVGTGASLAPNLTIGERSVVGAAAGVIRDVPAGARVGGVPARSLGASRRHAGS